MVDSGTPDAARPGDAEGSHDRAERDDTDDGTDDRDVAERQREIVEARPEGDERLYTGEPLDTGDGVERPAQQNVGRQREQGSGEWPHPRTPPREPDDETDHGAPAPPEGP